MIIIIIKKRRPNFMNQTLNNPHIYDYDFRTLLQPIIIGKCKFTPDTEFFFLLCPIKRCLLRTLIIL